MADAPDDTSPGSGREAGTGLADWQKVVAIVGLLLLLAALVFVGLAVIGGVGHTPPIQH